MQINPHLNVLVIAKTCLLLRLVEFLARFISPATLSKKRIVLLPNLATNQNDDPEEDYAGLNVRALRKKLGNLRSFFAKKNRGCRQEGTPAIAS
jgi:hypothetical protein